MLDFEFEKELLDALEKAEFGTDAIPAYTFNIIVPVIEKYAAQLCLQADYRSEDICIRSFVVSSR